MFKITFSKNIFPIIFSIFEKRNKKREKREDEKQIKNLILIKKNELHM